MGTRVIDRKKGAITAPLLHCDLAFEKATDRIAN
jgi:hypothetical protein|nr:MAG TPA_asm: hypothetical protein [Caudoviricetes sp.]